jgi:hypothetical protein
MSVGIFSSSISLKYSSSLRTSTPYNEQALLQPIWKLLRSESRVGVRSAAEFKVVVANLFSAADNARMYVESDSL